MEDGDDIDIEEHDLLDSSKIKGMFPDLSIVKVETIDADEVQDEETQEDIFPSAETFLPSTSQTTEIPDSTTDIDMNTLREAESPQIVTSTHEDTDVINNCIILGKKPATSDPKAVRITEDLSDSEIDKCNRAYVYLDDWGVYLNESDSYCKECEILFPTVNVLDSHKMTAHSYLVAVDNTDNKKPCFVCKEMFDNEHDLIEHVYLHVSKPVTCDICHEKFMNTKIMQRHKELKHTKLKNRYYYLPKFVKALSESLSDLTNTGYVYKCKICENFFAIFNDLSLHFVEYHSDEVLSSNLYRVVGTETPSPTVIKPKPIEIKPKPTSTIDKYVPESVIFTCSVCHLYFTKFNEAEGHKNCDGILKCNVQCQECELNFSKSSIESHRLQHKFHNPLAPIDINIENLSKRLLHQCPKCEVHFSDDVIWSHLDICTGEISYYNCNICEIFLDMPLKEDHKFCHGILNFEPNDFIIVEYVSARADVNDSLDNSEKNLDLVAYKYCKSCQCFISSLQNIQVHYDRDCSKGNKFVCDICGFVFDDESHRHTHMNEAPRYIRFENLNGIAIPMPKQEYFKCSKCDVNFNSSVSLSIHECQEVKIKQCKICDFTFDILAYEIHKNIHDKSVLRYYNYTKYTYCEECKACIVANKWTTHIKAHTSNKIYRKYTCDECGLHFGPKGYKNHIGLHEKFSGLTMKHFTYHGPNDNKVLQHPMPHYYVCRRCGSRAHSNLALRKHNIYKKCKDRISCSICNLNFIEESYNVHMLYHDYKNCLSKENIPGVSYKCENCKVILPKSLYKIHSKIRYDCNKLDYLHVACQKCDAVTYRNDFGWHISTHNQNEVINFRTIYQDNIGNSSQSNLDYILSKSNLEKVTYRQCKKCNLNLEFKKTSNSHVCHATKITVCCVECNFMKFSKQLYDKHRLLHLVYGDLTKTMIQIEPFEHFQVASEPKYTSYRCQTCSTDMFRKTDAILHMGDECRNTFNQCKICGLNIDMSFTKNISQHHKIHEKYPELNSSNLDIVLIQKKQDFLSLYQCSMCKVIVFHAKSMQEHKNMCSYTVQSVKLCKICVLPIPTNSSHESFHDEISKSNAIIHIIQFMPNQIENPSGPNKISKGSQRYTLYQCSKCDHCVNGNQGKTAHIVSNCTNDKGGRCKVCTLKVAFLSYHRKLHRRIPNYTLPNIRLVKFDPDEENITNETYAGADGKIVSNEERKRDHMGNLKHSYITIFKCVCGLSFITQMAINSHMVNCTGEATTKGTQCSKCPLVFNVSELVRHSFKHHSDDKCKSAYKIVQHIPPNMALECKHCKTKFQTKYQFQLHSKICGNDVPMKECKLCLLLIDDDNFDEHMRSHNVKKIDVSKLKSNHRNLHHCKDCNLYFLTSNGLLRHIGTGHNQPQARARCHLCLKTFSDRSLKQHIQIHHQNNTVLSPSKNTETLIKSRVSQTSKNVDKTLKSKYPYCKICKVHFLLKATQLKHMSNNPHVMVKKRIRCNVCHLHFSKISMRKHLIDHLNTNAIENVKEEERFIRDKQMSEQNISDRNKLMTKHLTAKPVHCKKCNVYFISLGGFGKHVRNNHPLLMNKLAKCTICRKKFLKQNMHIHLRLHHSKINSHSMQNYVSKSSGPFPCKNCNLYFVTQKGLAGHLSHNHSYSTFDYAECLYCQKRFSKKSMNVHINLHHKNETQLNTTLATKLDKKTNVPDPVYCEQCDLYFLTKNGFGVHSNRNHPLDETALAKCKYCDKRFLRKYLHLHFNFHHKDQIADTPTAGSLKIMKYAQQPVHCEHCDVYFLTELSFRNHLKSNHPLNENVIPVDQSNLAECKYCHRRFLRRYLHLHVKFYHEDQVSDVPETSLNYNDIMHYENEPAQCEQCDVYFLTKNGLEIHLKGNHQIDETNLSKCEYCQKRFLNRYLRLHVKYHHKDDVSSVTESFNESISGRKKTIQEPVQCEQCDLYFLTRNGFGVHLRSNHPLDETRIVRCKYCQKRFLGKYLHLHIKFHHEEESSDVSTDLDTTSPPKPQSPNSKHAPEPIHCEKCDVYFLTTKGLQRHLQRNHPLRESMLGECIYCNKRFLGKNLPLHFKLHHEDQRSDVSECLNLTKLSRNERYRERETKEMKDQIEMTEESEDDQKCEVNDTEKFESKLSQVIKLPNKQSPLNQFLPEPLRCEKCDVYFMTNIGLMRHQKIHPPLDILRKYSKCKLCQKIFLPHSVNTHLLFHHNIKSNFEEHLDEDYEKQYTQTLHKCKICEVNFFSGSSLAKHLEPRHYVYKEIIECKICSLKFSTAFIKRHMSVHHDISDGDISDPKLDDSTMNQLTDSDQQTNDEVAKTVATEKKLEMASALDENLTGDDEMEIDNNVVNTYLNTKPGSEKYNESSQSNTLDKKDGNGQKRISSEENNISYLNVTAEGTKSTIGDPVDTFDESNASLEDTNNTDPDEAIERLNFSEETTASEVSLNVTNEDTNMSAGDDTKNVQEKNQPINYYKCKLCNIHFTDIVECDSHIENHEVVTEYDFMECKICKFNFLIDLLPSHIRLHRNLGFTQDNIVVVEKSP